MSRWNILLFLFICFIPVNGISIGSSVKELKTCSNYDFEEKLLEKLVRIEHYIELNKENMKEWEDKIKTKLKFMNEEFNEKVAVWEQQWENRFTQTELRKTEQLDREIQTKFNMIDREIKNRTSEVRALQGQMSAGIRNLSDIENNLTGLIKENRKLLNDNLKPAFFALLKSHPFTATGINDVVKFDDVRINRGSGYNPATGYFTAPRKGLYYISCMILGIPANTFHFQLNKNNAMVSYGYIDYTENQSQTVSALVEMEKGDRVYIKHRVSSTETIHGNHHSTFSGHFVDL